MASSTMAAGHKRKAATPGVGSNATARKRQKYQDARTIQSQTADKALTSNGELNINSFIQSRQFEISALDKSMQKARQSLMSRAFQSVPRHLRRRTASHNAKKVPRRLRRRAEREMKEDNTPTVTSKTRTPTSKLRLRLQSAKQLRRLNTRQQNLRQRKKEAKHNAEQSDPAKRWSMVRVPRIKKNVQAEPPMATVKFKRRQLTKTWLPTHLWHTKRAHMTRPTEPLWRMAIPLTPSEKSYRPTHRAANSRGALAWDVSYMSTVGCLGTDHALENLLKSLGFEGEGWNGPRFRRWKAGTRFAGSWMWRNSGQEELLAPVLVIWAPTLKDKDVKVVEPVNGSSSVQSNVERNDVRGRKRKLDRRLLIRIHPSAFHEFWDILMKSAKMQKPQVVVEDLRFEIGSVDVTGPGSTEALNAILRPRDTECQDAKLWSDLAGITTVGSLPLNALLAIDIEDPRLNHPPRQTLIDQTSDKEAALLNTLTNWPIDAHPSTVSLFSNRIRRLAGALPSQKAVNRRRAQFEPGQHVTASPGGPAIPVVILARRMEGNRITSPGTWTVLAPWKNIDSIWRSLLYYPLSTGGHPRFGGLQEKQQIAFERCSPWFPGDMPGTEAGKAWERTQAERNFDEWIGKPPSRRLPFHSVDLGLGRRGEIGRGWMCDWDYLLNDTIDHQHSKRPTPEGKLATQVPLTQKTPLTQRQRKQAKLKEEANREATSRRRNTSSPDTDTDETKEPVAAEYSQMSDSRAKTLFADPRALSLPAKPALVSIRITLLTKGTPSSSARIYRLPKALPKSATSSTQTTTTEAKLADQDLVPSNSTPPAAQQSPATSSSTTTSNSKKSSIPASDLRSRWLQIYNSTAQCPLQNGTSKPIPKLRTNHHSLRRKHHVHPVPNLRDVIVIPPNAPQEVIDQHGPRLSTEAERREEQENALKIRLEEETVWDDHVPCPNVEDLIGFVTSGGYNLSEGRGTAIGSVWVQRLVERWAEEDNLAAAVETQADNKPTSGKRMSVNRTKVVKEEQRRVDGERHLCIVRNAGESVGRLGIWEICSS